jgi:hypothetical protein
VKFISSSTLSVPCPSRDEARQTRLLPSRVTVILFVKKTPTVISEGSNCGIRDASSIACAGAYGRGLQSKSPACAYVSGTRHGVNRSMTVLRATAQTRRMLLYGIRDPFFIYLLQPLDKLDSYIFGFQKGRGATRFPTDSTNRQAK